MVQRIPVRLQVQRPIGECTADGSDGFASANVIIGPTCRQHEVHLIASKVRYRTPCANICLLSLLY